MTYRITFLRHALSTGNRRGTIQGQIDFPLAEEGRAQVQALVNDWIAHGARFDLIISSPLLRALQTAERVSEGLRVPLEIDERWKEINHGSMQGEQYSAADHWFERNPLPDPYQPMFPAGESRVDLHARALQALQAILRRPAGAYLIVAHGGILNEAFRALLGLGPIGRSRGPRFHFDNTGYAVTRYDPSTGRWSIQAMNVIRHLDEHTPF
jgi:broad specificity phosphatase PhoE